MSKFIFFGLPQLVIGLATIPLEQKAGYGNAPYIQAGIGLVFVVVGIVKTLVNSKGQS